MAKRAKRLTRKEKIALGKEPTPKTKIAVVGNTAMASQLAAALAANPDIEVTSDYREPEYKPKRPGRDFFGKKDQ